MSESSWWTVFSLNVESIAKEIRAWKVADLANLLPVACVLRWVFRFSGEVDVDEEVLCFSVVGFSRLFVHVGRAKGRLRFVS